MFMLIFSRFIMLRGSSGFYSYAIYEHLKDWPDFDLGETRITFKLRKDRYTCDTVNFLLLFFSQQRCTKACRWP